jgi:osmotically-inducible protein OsmY
MRKALALAMVPSLAVLAAGCSPAIGYKEAAEAAMSPLSAPAQVRDQVLKMDLRRVLLETEGIDGVSLTPAVFMECGFVVGFTDGEEQADQIKLAAEQVTDLRYLNTYLPGRPAESTTESDLETKAAVKGEIALDPELVSTRYTVEVLNGEVVLLGVTMDEAESKRAARAAQGAGGVKRVTNWLMPVEEGYESIRPHLR